jgi:hypothetical protein
METFTYTASNAAGGFSDANVDMKVCGDVKSVEDIKLMLSGTVDFLISDYLATGEGFSITTDSVAGSVMKSVYLFWPMRVSDMITH